MIHIVAKAEDRCSILFLIDLLITMYGYRVECNVLIYDYIVN